MTLFYNIVVQTVIERSHMNNTINLINLKENDVESIDTARKEKTLYIYLTLKKVKEICKIYTKIFGNLIYSLYICIEFN